MGTSDTTLVLDFVPDLVTSWSGASKSSASNFISFSQEAGCFDRPSSCLTITTSANQGQVLISSGTKEPSQQPKHGTCLT